MWHLKHVITWTQPTSATRLICLIFACYFKCQRWSLVWITISILLTLIYIKQSVYQEMWQSNIDEQHQPFYYIPKTNIQNQLKIKFNHNLLSSKLLAWAWYVTLSILKRLGTMWLVEICFKIISLSAIMSQM